MWSHFCASVVLIIWTKNHKTKYSPKWERLPLNETLLWVCVSMSLIHENRYYIVAIITKVLDMRGSNNTHLFFILINLKVQNQGTVRMGVVKGPVILLMGDGKWVTEFWVSIKVYWPCPPGCSLIWLLEVSYTTLRVVRVLM